MRPSNAELGSGTTVNAKLSKYVFDNPFAVSPPVSGSSFALKEISPKLVPMAESSGWFVKTVSLA
jgi:hypothetical protein